MKFGSVWRYTKTCGLQKNGWESVFL